MATFTDIPPNFAQRALRARRARSAGASTGNTQHTCAGPTECARPHVHPPPAQHPTHNTAAHTTTYKLNGKRRVPRLSVRAADASCCMAVVLPLVEAPAGRWAPDRTKVPPVLVPLLSLGRRAVAMEGGGARAGTFSMRLAAVPAGGPALQAAHLSADLFEAAA